MNRSFLRLIAVAVFLGFLVAPGTGAVPESELRVPLRLTAPVPALKSVDDGDRVVPRIQGFGLTSRPGEPMLPLKVVMVAIPEGVIPELVVVSAESKLLPGRVSIAPVPRAVARGRLDDARGAPARGRAGDPGVSDILRDRELAFSPDPGIYGTDRRFPESPLRLGKIGYLREQRFVEVLFMPILYNPARGEARHVQEVRAEVRFKAPPGTRLAEVSRTYRPDPQFEDTYRASLLNYEQGKLFRVGRGETGQATATPTALPLSTVSQATTVPGSSRYKISVSTTGIYRLDYQYLQVNAPDLLAVDPRTLTLSAEGVEVPISIRNAAGDSGEADGRFDAGDFLEFIGRSKAEPPALLNYDFTGVFPDVYEANDFTDTQIYWLSAADPAGSHLRIPSASGALQTPAFTTATDFEDAAVWDENNLYLPLGDADPFFSIPSLLAGSAQATRDLILPLPGIAPGATTTSVKVRLRGGSDLTIAPDHRTQVWVNGASTRGIDFTWDGEVIEEQEFAVARSDLSDPTTIHLSAPGIAGVNVDSQYPDSVTLRYRRLFSAVNDLLPFTYPNQDARFQVSGFSGAAPTIYDVSRNLAGSGEGDPVRITGAVVSGFPGATYTFDAPRDVTPSAPAVRSFMVAGPGGVRLPGGIVRASDPTLHDPQNAADFLVVASRDTVDTSPGGALQALLDHRLLTQGLTSKTVFIDQIYDEFSYGLRDANAIRSFLAYAFDNWRGPSGAAPPPSYVLLVGDGVVDYKNTLNRSDWVDQVPTPIMFQQSSILGYYSSDNWIASFRGNDQVPDVYIGRISTRSAAESAGVFNKILRYEQSPPPGLWKGHAVLVAGDGKFTGEAQSFEAVQDSLASSYFSAAPYTVPNPPLYFAEAPWNTMGAGAFKNALVSQLQGGAVFLSFVGHGSFDVWGLDTFFTAQDASALNNDGSLPFMININCLSGGFHYLQGSGSLGEAMTNNPTGGAIATLAPSGLSNVFVGDAFNDLFASLFGPARERGLGRVTAALRAKLWSLGMVVDLQSYTLLGDPATPIAIPSPAPPSGLQAVAGNGQVSLSWSAPAEQVAGYRIYRATSSPAGQYQAITCDPVSATSCIDRSVVNATTYYYYATSTDAEGFGGRASNFNSDCDAGPDCVVARPINPNPPSVPVGLSSLDPGIGGVLVVSWLPNPETDIRSYVLHYDSVPGTYRGKVTVAATAFSTLLGGLVNGTRYYMALSAINTSGHESALSLEISDVPHLFQGIAPPRAITDLMITRSGGDLVLTWSRPTLDIYGRPTTVVKYSVYRNAAPVFVPSPASLIATILDGSVTTYKDQGAALAAGNAYYLVTATDNNGLVSGAGRELPNGIDDLSITLPLPGTVHLAWSAVTNDVGGYATIIDHYQVHMSARPLARSSLGPSTLVLDNVRSLSADLTASGAPLYFSVIAVDDRGNLSPF